MKICKQKDPNRVQFFLFKAGGVGLEMHQFHHLDMPLGQAGSSIYTHITIYFE
jgi:hypothetical protein